jgi:hypothetical protein
MKNVPKETMNFGSRSGNVQDEPGIPCVYYKASKAF